MRYISTRGDTPPLSFSDAVLTGLAPDGGLLLPESIPDFSSRQAELAGMRYSSLAVEIFSAYIDDIPKQDLTELVRAAYETFDAPDVAPISALGERYVLELFHGPTLAFKDVALQLLGKLFGYVLERRGGQLNILAATSGDTGSAAIAGVRGLNNVNIHVLFPDGRVSPLQELQMTTVPDENVHCYAVRGSFDDCQRLIKSAFEDLELKDRLHLGAVNSVNWARVLAQTVYYAYASLRLGALGPVSFTVPTGNFGNIFAAYLARRMGFPVDRLIVASNANNILPVYFTSGAYRRGDVHHTVAPAMDIQVASNFERYLYYRLGCDPRALKQAMKQFADSGTVDVPGEAAEPEMMAAIAVDDDEIRRTIDRIWRHYGYLLDPHTAIAVAASERFDCAGPMVCVATAHPAKFPETVDAAVGQPLARHPSLDALKGKPVRRGVLDANLTDVVGAMEAAP
ncbi:MAG: threonine synthase [Pseudomonadaceae bacterium]|nr:threonine synthase [Pseudomonadaceae bacterium]